MSLPATKLTQVDGLSLNQEILLSHTAAKLLHRAGCVGEGAVVENSPGGALHNTTEIFYGSAQRYDRQREQASTPPASAEPS